MRTSTRVAAITVLLIFGWLLSTLAVHPHLTPLARAASEDVEVWVEGPWAYADDPRPGQTGIVLIAPNGSSINHLPPAVSYADDDYQVGSSAITIITINNQSSASPCPAPCLFPSPQAVQVDKKKLVKLLNAPAGSYVISLPRPDYYEQAAVRPSRLRYGWWDECRRYNPLPHTPPDKSCKKTSDEKNFVTQMILHYTVTSLGGFTIGTAPHGFEDQRFIHIFMTPQGPVNKCDDEGRQAFAALVGLFTLKSAESLYVDLPNSLQHYDSDDPPNTSNCLDADPQHQHPGALAVAFLEDALENLTNYILKPDRDKIGLARASLERVVSFRERVPEKSRLSFDTGVDCIKKFLEKIAKGKKQSSSKKITVLQSLDAVDNSINRHDGSGACRNPLLPLSPM